MKNRKANLEKKHPNTFIIGFPKCGTTAMSNFLGQHPEVYFSPDKETSVYQNSIQIDKISYTKYLKLFDCADLSKHKVIAEGGITNICTETGIKEILRSKPDAKFIVMIRSIYLIIKFSRYIKSIWKTNFNKILFRKFTKVYARIF